MRLGKFRKIHFIGIGGIGMSGIAEILLKHGFQVSGSDLNLTEVTDQLASQGVVIYQGHSPKNLEEAEVVVYSSAVKENNSELVSARHRKIPVIRRAEMLAELMRMKFGIAVAGTHGKTTTTSMIGTILIRANLDPTIIVGGISPLFGSNARIGASEYLVAEADEFDRSFLKLTPSIAVITNLELEHLDCYRDLEDLSFAFAQFANMVPFYGTVILCLDDPGVQNLVPRIERPILTYGLDSQADIKAVNIEIEKNHSVFEVIAYGKHIGKIELAVPGEHNVKNSLAAVAVGLELEVPFEQIVLGLQDFIGVKRRFQIICERRGIMVVDDYAHHHSEIKATLSAAKAGFNRRIIAIFQPHLYSRTRDFYIEFGTAFEQADILFVLPIYPAREEPIPGISSELIVQSARSAGHQEAYYISDRSQLSDLLQRKIRSEDMVITMGAGDVWREAVKLCEQLCADEK
jgi:UDP-N-acetylmuramate--alanine ligase